MNNFHKQLMLITLVSIFSFNLLQAQQIISLAGDWQFQIDRQQSGEREKWYFSKFEDHILLPGSMPQRLKGDKPSIKTQWTGSLYDSSFYYNPYMEKYRHADNFKVPFFLTPDRHYVGMAWYKKTIRIPKDLKKQRIILFLERPHIETYLWINGQYAGHENSLTTPHSYDITNLVKSGQNTLTIAISNDITNVCVGADSHSVTDQTQGNWNGITGRIELQIYPKLYADDIQIYPDIHQKKAVVKLLIKKDNKKQQQANIKLYAKSFNTRHPHQIPAVSKHVILNDTTTEVTVELPIGKDMQLWDEFSPTLYELTSEITSQYGIDRQTRTFGMREFTIKGKMFYINGRQTMLRGTVENCDFPLTGYAPTDEASWERVFRICRSYGLNHMRFHSFCPPEAAFKAADKVGFYLQPAGPS